MAGKITFDAGNELGGNPMDAMQSEMTPSQPSQGANTILDDEQLGDRTGNPRSDEVQEDTLGGEAPNLADDSETKSPQTGPKAFKVKGAGQEREFKLDGEDPDLKRTLQYGMHYPEMKRRYDKATQELKKFKDGSKDVDKLKEKSAVWDEIQELARLGQHKRIAQAVLSESGYDALRKEIIAEMQLESGDDPEAKLAWERSQRQRDDEYRNHTATKKQQELEAKLQAYEERVETDRLRSLTTTALAQHDFRKFVKDPDVAHQLNQKTWKLVMSDLEDLAEEHDLKASDITPEMINKVVARNAKVLRGSQTKMAETKVEKIIETKKQEAKTQAQLGATERYPVKDNRLDGWDGRSAKDLLKRMMR